MLQSLFRRIAVAGIAVAAGLALLGGSALAWGQRVEGRPTSFQAGATDGYYIWHDADGFHLRTTDSAGSFEYKGTLRTDGTFSNVALAWAERDDRAQLLDAGHVLTFEFRTFEGIDGIDFTVDGGTELRAELDQDGQPISTSNIFLGQNGVNPLHDPVHLER